MSNLKQRITCIETAIRAYQNAWEEQDALLFGGWYSQEQENIARYRLDMYQNALFAVLDNQTQANTTSNQLPCLICTVKDERIKVLEAVLEYCYALSNDYSIKHEAKIALGKE